MTLREQGPVPQPFDLTRFLASSITFMVHIRSVSVFIDTHRLAHLTKSPGVPRELELPKVLKKSSGSGLMSVKSVQSAGEPSPYYWSSIWLMHYSSYSYPGTRYACCICSWH